VALGSLIVLLLVGLLSLMVRFRRALGVEVVAAQMADLRVQSSPTVLFGCSGTVIRFLIPMLWDEVPSASG
jgi:hypothetical protein